MWRIFHPSFSGTYKPHALSPGLLAVLAERIRSVGLFPKASKARNRYEVSVETDETLRFRSASLWTGINIGLNDVTLRLDKGTCEVYYAVTYWTWTLYALVLCIGICLILGFFFCTPLAGIYLFPADQYPPPSVIAYLVLPMLVFWGLVWPWILVAMHKRPAARCLVGILAEVNDVGDATHV